MCGLVAGIRLDGNDPNDVARVLGGVDRLRHRGPDGAGVRTIPTEAWTATLGMARLKIVDQSDFPVPMSFQNGVTLTWCGEIFNWRALRETLSDGTPWETNCDGEVVARAWRAWGPAMLEEFNGMWGLVLVDTLQQEVFIARDRAGEKPLYYAQEGKDVLWAASEIKGLPISLREGPCPELHALEYDCTEATPFVNVKALAPAHYLHFQPAVGGFLSVRWWNLPEERPTAEAPSFEDAVEVLTDLVRDAISIRVAPEVRTAVLLSGGLDSAIVQAVAKSSLPYCAVFPEVDPLGAAVLAAQGQRLRLVTFGYDDLVGILPKVAWHLDTPATWTAIIQWYLLEHVARDGAKVVLTGDGADELFHGYARHRLLWHLDHAADDPLLSSYGPLRGHLLGTPGALVGRLLDRSPDGTGAATVADLLARFAPNAKTLVEATARLEFHTSLQCLLRMADRMSAAHAVESRAPFLDHRVVEYAAALPGSYKITSGRTKAVLREVAAKLGVPEPIHTDAVKLGFTIPWPSWSARAGGTSGSRGQWDRSAFRAMMEGAWRGAFGLDHEQLEETF